MVIEMKSVLTNNKLLSALAVIALIIGATLSIGLGTFQWLSRFGDLVVCIGIIVLARPNILGEELRPSIKLNSGYNQLDKKHYEKTGEPFPTWWSQNERSRIAVSWLGPLLCFVGTATNGFADLLNILLNK